MDKDTVLFEYVIRMADNALILSQRLGECVGHGPELEEEMATANFALDYIGQARMLYILAGELDGSQRSEDEFAFLRDGWDYHNLLLLEQPNGDFGDSIVRQVLFETFLTLQLQTLCTCTSERLAEIAARALKESQYHLRHATHWLMRLGDGTDESHERVQGSVNRLWCYSGELFAADEIDAGMQEHWNGPDLDAIRAEWDTQISQLLANATLSKPEDAWMHSGGKQGVHSEHLGHLLADMQFLQRAYPGLSW
jgi:ring-1,2-phenylacetyl-CoA epoxidase subunit PaaC